MVMRVTQQSIYGSVIRNTNANLSNLMDTNVQSSSQKRINSPSDDPTGTVQVLNCRSSLSQYTQYQSNITQANSWLNQSNSALTSVSTLISSIKALAEQGATGSVTAANRDQIAASARQYFQQLISLANTKNGSDSLYAGQKTDTDAFATTLAMNSNDTAFSAAVASNGGSAVTGSSNTTVFVQFMGTDTVTHQPAFQYSTDGGSTWTNGTYSSPVPAVGKQQLQMGGVTISMGHFTGRAAFDGDFLTGGKVQIKRRSRGGDIEGHAVGFGDKGHGVGADLVGRVAVGRDTVRADYDLLHHAVLHKVSHGIVAGDRDRDAFLGQLVGRQAGSLEKRPRFVGDDLDALALFEGGADGITIGRSQHALFRDDAGDEFRRGDVEGVVKNGYVFRDDAVFAHMEPASTAASIVVAGRDSAAANVERCVRRMLERIVFLLRMDISDP